MKTLAGQRGLTLIELLVVVGFVTVLSALASLAYFGVTAEAEEARVRGDLRTLTTAVMLYAAETGGLPAALDDLTRPVELVAGRAAGPFLTLVPRPPTGWGTAYGYERGTAPGSFTIVASGDGRSLRAP